MIINTVLFKFLQLWRSIMKKLMTCLALLVAIAVCSVIPTEAATKRVLVEDHTGAWCGWCPIGIFAMDELYAKHPDKFIPVALHNNDKMSTPLQSQLSSVTTIGGFPSGVINRKKHDMNDGKGAVYGIHPAYWEDFVPTLFAETSIVEMVSVTYDINKETKQLTATVTVRMEEDYDGQLAFNLYIMHDGMTGTGTGWDQANYLTSRAGYEDNPFYSLPSTVTGIFHDNVMIDMLGGAFGVNGQFPAKALKDQTYTHTFTSDLSKLTKIQNMDKIWVVGTVAKTGTEYDIMNSLATGKQAPKAKYSVATTTQNVFNTTAVNTTFTKEFTIKNTNSLALDADLIIDLNESEIPSGWTVSLDKNTVNIPAQSQATVTLNIQTDGDLATATISVKSTVKGTDEYEGLSQTAAIFILTEGFTNLVYHFGETNVNGFYQALYNLTNYMPTTALIPYSTSAITAYSNYNYNTLIIPEGYGARGTIADEPALIQYVKSRVDAGKPVLMASNIDMFFVAGNYADLNPVQSIKTFFNTTWGITGLTQSSPLMGGDPNAGTRTVIPMIGSDNEITKDMSFNINDNATYYSYFLDQIKILDNTKATPILKYSIGKTDEESIAAVKIKTATNRNIYCGIGLDIIGDVPTRTTLLGNMLTWLNSTTDVVDFNNFNTSNISIFPNPCVSTSIVKFEAANASNNADVYLVDATGARVMTISNGTVINAGTNQFEINASNLSSGKYYVMTNVDGIYSQAPIVIAK